MSDQSKNVPDELKQTNAAKPLTALQRQALLQKIQAQLPQTQCTRCGYADCADYAQAIVDEGENVNRCQPGGYMGIQALAKLTQQRPTPLAADVGEESTRVIVYIDEDWCIGCTKCILTCPVDAILGASKHMHIVIEAHCTGCTLCLPVCPVDCIKTTPALPQEPQPTGWAAWSKEQANNAQKRYAVRHNRLPPSDGKDTKSQLLNSLALEEDVTHIASPSIESKQKYMAQIMAKAKQNKSLTIKKAK